MTKQKKTHPRQKAVYHVRNWAEYERALVKRYSLTVWISEETYEMWKHNGPNQRGAQFVYSDQAIETMLTMKEVYGLTNRGVEGFVGSLFQLLTIDLPVPDHTTLSKRGKGLEVALPRRAKGPMHIVMDSTGLKLYGEGEWKVRKHGWSKHRTWCKLHLMVDAASGEIQALDLTEAGGHDAKSVGPMLQQLEQSVESFTGDGGYDKRATYVDLRARAPNAKIVIPPRKNARIWQHGNRLAPPLPRDENLRYIRKHGRKGWKQHSGYHRRSLAETTVFRVKIIFGSHLSNRLMATQTTQAKIRCSALNRMTHLGVPQSYLVT